MTIDKRLPALEWVLFSSAPRFMIGLLQDESAFDDMPEDLLEMVVRGNITSGSVNTTAVAGIDLGIKNPVSSSSVEKTEITAAPVTPDTKTAT